MPAFAMLDELNREVINSFKKEIKMRIDKAISNFGKTYISYFIIFYSNYYICLLVLSDYTLLVVPSLMCSFAANYHLNFTRRAPSWPCSLVGRATVICSGGRGFECYRILFLRVGPFPLQGYRSEGIIWDIY